MPSGVLNYQAKNLYVNLRCLRQRAVGDTMSVTTDRKAVIPMLNENIKTIRKSKGLSQEELAVKLNVVRQTVSKWEQGLSVPDSDMLISLSDAFETPVSTLLGENVAKQEANELKAICEKLEVINLQLARRKIARRAALHWLFIALCAAIIIISAVLIRSAARISDGISATRRRRFSARFIMCSSGCLSDSRRLLLSVRSSEFL